MEKFNISYSTKNIPLPSHNDYLQRLIERTEKFLHRMRWKAHSFLNPDTTSFTKETYGFKSTKNPPSIEELKDFEDDMLKMIQSVKFKQVNNPFLNRLKENTDHIKNEPKLLIAADKTTNFYKLEPSTYNDLLEKNITKSYEKALPETTQAIHKENKDIATKLGIDDRVDTTADKDAFITLKTNTSSLSFSSYSINIAYIIWDICYYINHILSFIVIVSNEYEYFKYTAPSAMLTNLIVLK